jgi:hypothetical protein
LLPEKAKGLNLTLTNAKFKGPQNTTAYILIPFLFVFITMLFEKNTIKYVVGCHTIIVT